MKTNGTHPDFTVSIVPQATSTATSQDSFRALMASIGNGRWAEPVSAVRAAYANGGKDAASGPKKRLPGILFSGTFSQRSASALTKHSGLICADVDEIGPQLDGIRDFVINDPHTLACFVSPSGTGLKVIFRCDPNRPHIESFHAAEQHMLKMFGLEIDQACKDVSRLCFVSHDPDAFVANDAEILPYPESKPREFKAPVVNAPSAVGELSPGDDYDARGDICGLLSNHGWTKIGQHGWTRPGKTSGVSATWDKVPRRLYVFSDATDFEPNHVYRPWHVFAILECGGDFKRAAGELAKHGFGTKRSQRPMAAAPSVASAPAEMMDLESGPVQKLSSFRPRPINVFTYPEASDPNILLGSDDYLGRGGGMLFVSHAGAGKSSWIMDGCMTWALGQPWMGIKPNGKLRSLIVQAEDSDRYIGKISASFAHVHNLDDETAYQLGERCQIVRVKGVSGPNFFNELRLLIAECKPDLVIINPIYLYAEGDIGRSEFTQPFLLALDALNKEEKFAYILIHHTGKPQAKGKDGKRAEVEDWESAYMGFGSSYLANWPRCTALLEPVSGRNGSFMIKLGKGGLNAGVTKKVAQGAGFRDEPTTRIAIKHSSARMANGKPVYYWEKDTEAESDNQTQDNKHPGGRPKRYSIGQFMEFLPRSEDKAMTRAALLTYAREISDISDTCLRNVLNHAVDAGVVFRCTKPGSGFAFWVRPQEGDKAQNKTDQVDF